MFLSEGTLNTDTQEACHVTRKAETEAMCLHAKEHQGCRQPPEARKKNGKILPLSPQEIINPDTLISDIWPPDM